MVIATAIFYSLLLALALVWMRISGLKNPFPGGLSEGLPGALALAVAAATLVVVGSLVTHRRLQWAQALEVEFRKILGERGPAEVILLALFSGVAEEAFFRGAMQPVLGLVWTSLIFGGIHFIPQRVYLPWTIFAVVVGFLLGWIYQVTGNIYAPTVAHVLINGVNLWRICGPGAPSISPAPSDPLPGPVPGEETPPPSPEEEPLPPPVDDSARPELPS